jgi:hypothetical protein
MLSPNPTRRPPAVPLLFAVDVFGGNTALSLYISFLYREEDLVSPGMGLRVKVLELTGTKFPFLSVVTNLSFVPGTSFPVTVGPKLKAPSPPWTRMRPTVGTAKGLEVLTI